MEHPQFFLSYGKTSKSVQRNNKHTNSRVSYVMPNFPNGSAGGRFVAYAVLWRHKPFNLHTFRPYYFSQFSEKCSCFTSGQRADISGSWYIFSSSAGKGQHGRSRRVTKARELRRASGRKQLTDKFVCLPDASGTKEDLI